MTSPLVSTASESTAKVPHLGRCNGADIALALEEDREAHESRKPDYSVAVNTSIACASSYLDFYET